MPLTPIRKEFLNLPIKQYIITAPSSQAAPFNIFIYQLPDLPQQFNTSLAEYYVRCQKFNRLKQFKANYYVDNLSIWETSPPQGKIVRVAICGTKERTYKKTVKLITNLAQYLTIPQEQIKLRFSNENFSLLLSAAMEKIRLPHKEISHQDFFQEPAAYDKEVQLTYKMQVDNNWTETSIGKPLHGLKFSITQGKFLFRIWSGGTWYPWTDSKVENLSSIEGFQFELQDLPNYNLFFRVHFLNENWTKWKDKYISIPYQKTIDSIELKLKRRDNDD